MIAISEPFRGAQSLRLLFDSFCQALDHLSTNGVFVSELVANAFSETGMAMCKSFKMQPVVKNKIEGTVFSAPISNVLTHPMARRYPDLIRKYRVQGLIG
jgi:hypothetical protein